MAKSKAAVGEVIIRTVDEEKEEEDLLETPPILLIDLVKKRLPGLGAKAETVTAQVAAMIRGVYFILTGGQVVEFMSGTVTVPYAQ